MTRASVLCAFCWFATIVIIFVFIVLTLVSTSTITNLKKSFDGNASQIFTNWNSSLYNSISSLQVVGSLFTAVDQVNNCTFGRFLDLLNKPNTTIVWAEVVRKENLASFEENVRLEGFSNFIVFGMNNQSKEWEEFLLPILYFYPPRTASTLGFNLLSDPERRKTIEIANQTRSIASTGRIYGITSINLSLTIIYKPVFKRDGSLKGVVYQGFSIDTFVNAMLHDVDQTAYSIVWRDLLPDSANDSIIYQSSMLKNSTVKDPDPAFSFQREIEFAQRHWQLEVLPNFSTNWRLTTNAAWFLAILFLIAITVSVVSAIFIKNRIKLRQQEPKAQLLRMVVPEPILKQLGSRVKLTKEGGIVLEGDTMIAEQYSQVALCFIDICNFTVLSSTMTAQGLVRFLDEFFTLIDSELSKYGKNLAKIKTIGDAYFAVAGLQCNNDDVETNDERPTSNLLSLIDFSFAIQEILSKHRFQISTEHRHQSPLLSPSITIPPSPETKDDERIRCQEVLREMMLDDDGHFLVKVRIGIHCGDVVAGVVGKKQPQYDVWGNACNVVSHIESVAKNGTILVSETVRNILLDNNAGDKFHFRKRRVLLKGFGREIVYELSKKEN